ncbi:MAG: tetratricopeptide repeat protein, partial [Bacteroidales bacterium]|nr:tetratricopeptide repeat protein [Bacteroidales bacterium]
LEMQNMAYYNQKNYQAVLANGERMLAAAGADKEKQVVALSTIGDMYYNTGDKKNAYKTYEKALKINPDYAPVLNNYAWYLCQEGSRLKYAYKMSKKTVEQEPDNVTYLDTFGWILHLMGKDLEAKPFFKHAMLYGGKDSRTILLHYARVLEVLGEDDLALTYRNQAEKLPEE